MGVHGPTSRRSYPARRKHGSRSHKIVIKFPSECSSAIITGQGHSDAWGNRKAGGIVHLKSQNTHHRRTVHAAACPCGFARTIAGDGLPDFHAFQCDLCGVAVSGEAVAEALELVRVGRQWPEPLFAAQAVTPNSSRPRQLMVPEIEVL